MSDEEQFPSRENHPRAKVTDQQIHEIRYAHEVRKEAIASIAKRLDIPFYTVRAWCRYTRRPMVKPWHKQIPSHKHKGAVANVDGSWPNDTEHENGNYMNTCSICNSSFIGHKRRVVCRTCSDGET